jgi:hypothetical protein
MRRCLAPLALLALLTPIAVPAQNDEEPAFLVLPYLQLPTPTSIRVLWEVNQKLSGEVEYGTTAKLGQTVKSERKTDLHEISLKDLKPDTTYYYRVRSGNLVSEVFKFQSAPAPGTKKWRMALYGDSRSNPPVHQKVAEQIVKADVRLIVHSGDIVINGKSRDAWRREFFEPLGGLARSVPWAATIGNHENDSEHFFSYVALPDGQRYFGFDFANAHFICLDSNAWIEKGRDSEQYGWLEQHLKAKRSATWTFVVFHHPLFSAIASRPINPLRWDWAPLLIDPANKVDGVLAGHDHFYARNYRMGRLSAEPQHSVFFLTSAGGGAFLYKSTDRDYVAKHKPVHHYVLFEFDDEQVKLSAIDTGGNVFDTYTLTKKPAPADDLCAYEIEELREHLRKALAAAPGISTKAREATVIDTQIRVPARFSVPVEGELIWKSVEGWKLKEEKRKFRIEPHEPLIIPLQAEIVPGRTSGTPTLTIQFASERFRNRAIEVVPFKLAGPERIAAAPAKQAPAIDGQLNDEVWKAAASYPLIGVSPAKGRSDQVQIAADKERLYVAARLDDPKGKAQVKPADPKAEPSRAVLFGEHVQVTISSGKQTWVFALSPEQIRYTSKDGSEDTSIAWQAAAAQDKKSWTVEFAIPRKTFPADGSLRINVTHQEAGLRPGSYELCPTYTPGIDPDVIPDWAPSIGSDSHARLLFE